MRKIHNMTPSSRKLTDASPFQVAAIVVCVILSLVATGCTRAPSFNLLGSFFPAWIICGVIGIVLAVGVRLLFVRAKFEQELSPLIVVYPCLAAFFTFTIWLLFFS